MATRNFTLAPQDAIDYATSFIKDMPLDRVATQLVQDSSNQVWSAAPWWWTMGTLSPITLVEGSQNHNVVSPPASLLRLERCYITDGATQRSLTPVSMVPGSATLSGLPNFVAYMEDDEGVTPAQIQFEKKFTAGGSTWKFFGWYKTEAPLLAASLNTPGALLMPDDYFHVFREGVLYYAYKWATDPRAGGATVQVNASGQRVIGYSGQLGVFRAAIEEMRQQETVIREFPDALSAPLKEN